MQQIQKRIMIMKSIKCNETTTLLWGIQYDSENKGFFFQRKSTMVWEIYVLPAYPAFTLFYVWIQ